MSILDPQEHYDIIFGGGSPEDSASFLQDYTPATGVELTIGDVVGFAAGMIAL